MGVAIVGALMIVFPLTLRIVSLRAIRQSPKSEPTPWTWTLRAPMMWAGVVLVIAAINQTAGGIALFVGIAVLLAFAAKLVINAPGAARRSWRTIGDPDAWRGTVEVAGAADTGRFGHLLWHKIALGTFGVLLLVLVAALVGQH